MNLLSLLFIFIGNSILNKQVKKNNHNFVDLDNYSFFFNNSRIINNNNNNNNYIIPNTIWIYWEGSIPSIVAHLIHHLKVNFINYNIIIINQRTVRNYISSSSIPSLVYSLPQANQCDYYRFNIISIYGGIFIDGCIYIKDEEIIDNIIREMKERKTELYAFNSFFHPLNNIELSFIISPMNSKIINIINNVYIRGLIRGRQITMKRMVNEYGIVMNASYQYRNNNNNNNNNNKIFRIKSKPFYSNYFFSYYCVQYVIQYIYNNNPNIIIKDAEEWSYKFMKDCCWSHVTMNLLWNNNYNSNNIFKEYPIIKINGENRPKIKDNFNGII